MTRGANAAFLDALTLQGAGRMLATQYGDLPSYNPSHSDKVGWRTKWDYDLNQGFRVASDIACLSQMVQAIITHDKIIIDGDQIPRWIDLLPVSLSDGFIFKAEVTPAIRAQAYVDASRVTRDYVRSDALPDFLGRLSEGALDSGFISISDHYFTTGYDDWAIFSYKELLELAEFDPLAKDHDRGDASKKAAERLGPFADMFDREAHVLRKTKPDDQRSWDQAHAAQAVIRNIHAAVYYQILAYHLEVSYIPHPLRANFVTFHNAATSRGLDAFGQLLKSITASRKPLAESVNEFVGHELVEADLPLFLAQALEESNSPADVLEAAVTIRESPEGRRLRKWMGEFNLALLEGSLDSIRNEVRKVESLAESLSKSGRPQAERSLKTSFEINFGVLSVTQELPPWGSWTRPPWRRHLKIVQSLHAISQSVASLDEVLRRIYGNQVALAWAGYSHAIRRLSNRAYSGDNPLNLIISSAEMDVLRTSRDAWDRRRAKIAMQDLRASPWREYWEWSAERRQLEHEKYLKEVRFVARKFEVQLPESDEELEIIS